MRLTPEGFPDFRDIDTPWDPQPIAWRYDKPYLYKRSPLSALHRTDDFLRQQVANPQLTHLVREVDVLTDSNPEQWEIGALRPVEEVRDSLLLVDDQFRQLEELTNLRVAPTQWHVFADPSGKTRTLARVEIIDGDERIWPDTLDGPEAAILTPDEAVLLEAFNADMDTYYRDSTGRQLVDIYSASQFKLGTPRTHPLGNRAFFLIDIEPVLDRYPRVA